LAGHEFLRGSDPTILSRSQENENSSGPRPGVMMFRLPTESRKVDALNRLGAALEEPPVETVKLPESKQDPR
jgi:hypothetical protein